MKNKLILWVIALCMVINFQSCLNNGDPHRDCGFVSSVSYLENKSDEAVLILTKFYPVCSDTAGALVTWEDSLIYIAPGGVEKILDYTMLEVLEVYLAEDTTFIAAHSGIDNNISDCSTVLLINTPVDFEYAERVVCTDYDYPNLLGIKSERYNFDSFDFNYYPINYLGDRGSVSYDSSRVEIMKEMYARTCPGYAVIRYYELDLSADCFKR